MDNETRDILNIIKSGITGLPVSLSEDFSFDELLGLAKKHNILTLVYYGLFNSKIPLDKDIKTQLYQKVIGAVAVNEAQLHYVDKLSKKFCENNIDHMLLKGSVLKHLYPKPEIRRMGDIDILIKEEQYGKICEVMRELGFSFKYESNHELVWAKDNIAVELHKILMPSYNKDLHSYFGNGWRRAISIGGSGYSFSDEDMFVYIFSHFAKHYRDAGIGIMHMCDLYVYLKAKELDYGYICAELKKLKLYDFYCNVKATLDVWFEEGQSSEMTDYITEVILSSGVYGVYKNSLVSGALKGRKRFKKLGYTRMYDIFRSFFPSYNAMKTRYTILKKAPVLLPVFWVWRLIVILFTKHKKIGKKLNEFGAVSEQAIDEYERALNYVGLDYNFK